MALPPMIVMVIATIVIALAARPLDWSPSLTPPARSGSVAVGGDEDDDVQVRHVRRTPARVLPPERVVYVPGWRAATTAPGPSASRPAKVRLGAAGLDDAGRPWAPSAVQAP
jgi:hypothetical protein